MIARAITTLAALLTVAAAAGCGWAEWREQPGVCDICNRQIHGATHYRLHLEGDQTFDACCPRCGLHYEHDQSHPKILQREVADFDSGTFIEAADAFYVEGSSVHLCCEAAARRDQSGRQYVLDWDRCLPSLVAFRTQEGAERFQQRHGGKIKSFDQLLLEWQVR